MSESTTNDSKNLPHGQESEAEAAARRAGKNDKSSEDAKSREKAGSDKGAGGGAKQEQKH